MHELLLEKVVETCRSRYAEGDCVITKSCTSETLENAVIQQADEILKLNKQLETLRGAMVADDARLRDAGMRSDCYAGCDTPDAMADRISRLRSELHSIRDTTIEDCARVADHYGQLSDGFTEEVICAESIAQRIRALKDKNPREE